MDAAPRFTSSGADTGSGRRRALRLLAATSAWAAVHPLGALAASGATPLTLFAAASTRDALLELEPIWARTGQAGLRLVFAASSALARQIEQGAPADLVLSADTAWMQYLDQRALVTRSSIHPLLGNALVLIAPAKDARHPALAAGQQLRLAPGVDLRAALAGGRLALGDVRSVPAGRYAQAALAWLGAWDALQGHLAMSENVRAALALVARGEAPLGIVYASDAQVEPRVRVLAVFPRQAHPAILYPLARVAASRHPQAETFHAFLRSAAASEVFRRHGFLPPPSAGSAS